METLDEDIALLKDVLRLPDPQYSSFPAHDGLVAVSSDQVQNGNTKVQTQTESVVNEIERFIQGNKSSYKKTIRQYDAMLTDTERDLIYTAYYKDYLLFGYEPRL